MSRRRGEISSMGWLDLALAITLALAPRPSSASPAEPRAYAAPEGPFEVVVEYAILTDPSRGWDDDGTPRETREIPVKAYVPAAPAREPFPLILLSHGLGGDVEALAYMAERLASAGYVVVALQHHRSDGGSLAKLGWRAFLAAANQPETRRLRPEDVSFVLDWLSDPANAEGDVLEGRADLSRVGLLGHSFGAWTTLACLGQTFDGGNDASDGRFLCGVAYSPQGAGTMGVDPGAWAALSRPTLTMGGAVDASPFTRDPADRRQAFDSMPATGSKYHATLEGAVHGDFGNEGGATYHEWIGQMTLAFFDSVLKGEASAKTWLESGDIEGLSSGVVKLETK